MIKFKTLKIYSVKALTQRVSLEYFAHYFSNG